VAFGIFVAYRTAINHRVAFDDTGPSRLKPHQEVTPEARSTRSFGAKQHSAAKFIPQNIYMPMVGLLDLPGAEAIAFKPGLSGRETPLGQIAHSALSPLGGVLAARSGDLS
jgi:hypothetical protein